MKLETGSAPYLRNKRSTLGIMVELTIVLLVVWLAAVVTTFVKLGTGYGTRSILLLVVSLAVTALCDFITTAMRKGKSSKGAKEFFKHVGHDLIYNYSWVTAIILVLISPVWTPYYAMIIASAFATLIIKNAFGGFGANIFNPAAFGRILLSLSFGSALAVPADITNGVVSGATITTIYKSTQDWLGTFAIEGFTVKDMLLGTYFGAMGEPFTVLLVVAGIYLAVRGIINWRAPVFYVGTVTLTSLLIALVLGFENPFLYVLYHLALGGLMFGAVFMITDPVTTPTTHVGNFFVGIIAGLLTVLIRIATKSAEGVIFSIALVNLITPTIDRATVARTCKNQGVKYGVTFGTLALTLIICTSCAWVRNGGREVYDINGIHRLEYEALQTSTNFEFMEENEYQFATYKKETPTDAALVEINDCKKAYSIVDKEAKEVAVVYCVKIDNIEIKHAYAQAKVTGIAYVAISTSTNQIIDMSLATVPFIGGFEGRVNDAINAFDFVGTNILDVAEKDIVSGATMSSTGIKQIAQKAVDIYNSQYAA